MTTTLVTGATGALGVPTVSRLRAAGHDVRALSRRSGPGLTTGDLRAVLVLHTDGERLTGLDLVVNPEKLTFAQGQLSRIGGLSGLSG